jgi:DNA-binding MarR family transcriptional regulator
MSTVVDALMQAQRMHLVTQVMENDKIARSVGLALTEAQVLHLLVLRPDQRTARALTRTTGLPTSTLTDIVERLVRAGFVERRRSTTDRRVVHLEPTERVQLLVERYAASPMSAQSGALLAGFTRDELAVVLRYFERANELASSGAPAEVRALPAGVDAGSAAARTPGGGARRKSAVRGTT